MKLGKTGIARIIAAVAYSIKGLRFTWKNEAAFRQECLLSIVLIPIAFILGDTTTQISLLLLPIFLTLIIELINSAIEAIVDRISSELHELSGAAKDIGSAAVLMSLILWAVIWLSFLFEKFMN